MPIPAQNINEVISELDFIVLKSIHESSKFGLFAALYKKVTEKVRDGIINNRFKDGARMEQLDVVFANRYLEAYKQYFSGKPITNAWYITFEAAKKPNVLILQHLLSGMNAHISLDLGIATAQVGAGKPIQDIERDFNEINNLLGDLIENVQNALSKNSSFLATIDFLAGKIDEKLARFNLEVFRKRAWQIASTLHGMDENARTQHINALDMQVRKENKLLTGLGSFILPPITMVLAKLQNQSIADVIRALNAI
jgi:hypothetical protein